MVWVLGGVFALAFVGLFWRWIWTQHLHSADKMQDWGHSYVIPAISAFLVWRKREEIASAPVYTFWPALPPLLLGIASYFFFVVGFPNHMLQGLAMILSLGASALLVLGPSVFRFLFLPIAYLGFAITISEQVMIQVTFPLQLIAAKGAWLLLALFSKPFGYFADVSGNMLTMTDSAGNTFPLNVAEACSGMRMVVAFFALAAAVALIQCSRWWERLAVFLIAAPVAVFLNTIRVAILAWLTLVDPNLATGDAHMAIGTLLLIPGLGMYLLAVWALGRIIIDPVQEAAREAKRNDKDKGAANKGNASAKGARA